MPMTIIMIAMQNSLISFESSKTGWKTNESLKQTHPHIVSLLILEILIVHTAELLVMDCGKLRILDKLGIELERMR